MTHQFVVLSPVTSTFSTADAVYGTDTRGKLRLVDTSITKDGKSWAVVQRLGSALEDMAIKTAENFGGFYEKRTSV